MTCQRNEKQNENIMQRITKFWTMKPNYSVTSEYQYFDSCKIFADVHKQIETFT